LLLCAADWAEKLGIARERWVFPWASTESSHMVAVSARADLAVCDGARLAGRAALTASGIEDPTQLDLVELYSCFPVAVELYAHELGLPLTRDLTVTGGMPFAGGPYNNYVLQATCRMARLIRDRRGRNGLVSSVSGILTKQGFGLWAQTPPPHGFTFADVSADTARLQARKEVVEGYRGPARVAGYTVVHEKSLPHGLVLADTPDGRRALATSIDPAVTRRLQAQECCGTTISIDGDTFAMT
jgi:acetyl-CoA C-acetyltransferase